MGYKLKRKTNNVGELRAIRINSQYDPELTAFDTIWNCGGVNLGGSKCEIIYLFTSAR